MEVNLLKILFIGDIVGNSGRKAAKEMLCQLKKEKAYDYCIANGENAAGGNGLTYMVAQELFNAGVDVITLGNHTWAKKEIIGFINSEKRIVRPANYPSGLPGRGSTIINGPAGKIGVINVLGRVYMDSVDCPFRAADREIEYLKDFVNVIIVDFHAETTSEKNAFAWYLDGKVSAVFGTHTHVQTADERILHSGTCFITDVGMTGPYEGVIGVDRDIIIKKFMTHMTAKFELAKGKLQFNAVIANIDENNGKTTSIQRIFKLIDI